MHTELFSGVVGSRLYGTHNEDSDYDRMRVCLVTPEQYLTEIPTQSNQAGETSSYEFRFFCHLCRNGNLNVLPLLWSKDIYHNHVHKYGFMLLSARSNFLSLKLVNAGIGYATHQLNNALNPDKIATGDFGAKRKKLVEDFGFDTKAAMHAIRLGRMTYEFVTTGDLNVRRPDSDYLRSVREGLVPLDVVSAELSELIKSIESEKKKNKLDIRAEVDTAWYNSMLVSVLKPWVCGA